LLVVGDEDQKERNGRGSSNENVKLAMAAILYQRLEATRALLHGDGQAIT
jgi:hypothetical protein